jgi:hypothetical protein
MGSVWSRELSIWWHQETCHSSRLEARELADLDLDLDLEGDLEPARGGAAARVKRYSPPLISQLPPAIASPFPTRRTICQADLTAPLNNECSM